MKPEYYSKSQYLKVYDLFSSHKLYPISKIFLDVLNLIFQEKISMLQVNKKILITDMGAGSGYHSSLFLIKNKEYWDNIKFTCCEPNKDMRELLLTKVTQCKNKQVIDKTAQEYLENLDTPQDIFIFQRCLYAFYGKKDFDKYYDFVKKLYSKTKDEGYVMVYDFDSLYDIPSLKNKILKNRNKIGLSEKSFFKYWDILKTTLEAFNEGVKKEELTLFSQDLLLDIFFKNNFLLVEMRGNFLIFKKEANSTTMH